MKAIHKRLIKLEEFIERRDAPRISELIRARYATMRAAQGMPPEVPQKDTRGLSIAEILRERRARRTAQSRELGSENEGSGHTTDNGKQQARRRSSTCTSSRLYV